ncbi:MAG: hypothetical protein IJF60_01900 [Agathobacter sp.]|nr:hypothetical protein [Agathobacter sp.]
MKCINCGANFQTEELRCPYCGSKNVIGEEWEKERVSSKSFYERMREQFYKEGIAYTCNKILNKAILILVIALFGTVILYILPSLTQEGSLAIKKKVLSNQIEKQMEEYHSAGDWDGLERYMSEYDMYGEETYVYTQAAFLARDYRKYMMNYMDFLAMSEEEQLEEDNYELENVLQYSHEVVHVNCGIYDELCSENEEMYQIYRKKVLDLWKGGLGLNDEEIDFLLENDYLYMEDEDRYLEIIKERQAWK